LSYLILRQRIMKNNLFTWLGAQDYLLRQEFGQIWIDRLHEIIMKIPRSLWAIYIDSQKDWQVR